MLFTMATARRLSMIFVVGVLVAIIGFADVANGAVSGKLAGRTTLLSAPGAAGNVITTLDLNTVVNVLCRRQSDIVFDDPWWLQVTVSGMAGWVADYYVICPGAVGPCVVPLC